MDVSKIDPEKLMSLYSIVFQDVTLFDNSILENIRIGRKDATDEEVIAAAKLANVDKFAEKLPDSWNANIGENGCELSGGERQRISIARAFLKDAPIILLDEATASLDVENETAIQEALSRLIRNKTVLIIAHRMRTVSGADKIVVLKDGAVAEQGSPAAAAASRRHLRPHGAAARPRARTGRWRRYKSIGKIGQAFTFCGCEFLPYRYFQCRDNRNDSDPSPFVHFVYHTTILEIKRRNPNPSPTGIKFGFLKYGGA